MPRHLWGIAAAFVGLGRDIFKGLAATFVGQNWEYRPKPKIQPTVHSARAHRHNESLINSLLNIELIH